jgi:aryl-alcohol dehydrogenase-like predicted oxidoreductase
MAMLCRARLVVASVPFDRWRNSLGAARSSGGTDSSDVLATGRRLAAHVEWAAVRLPFSTKCLPQAMALSWMLRRKAIDHQLVLAARPAHLRDSADALHAWVELHGEKIIGDLPGPWIETLRLGG